MLKLKGCPRCKKGNLVLDGDYYGWHEYCIQCGYTRDLKSTVELGQWQARSEKKNERRATTLGKRKVASDE